MKSAVVSSFAEGDVHCNRVGYYRVESLRGDEVLCRYFDTGKKFKGSQSRLKKIESKHLGFSLPALKQARQILKRCSDIHPEMDEVAIVKMAGLVLEEERKKRDKDNIQLLYEDRLRRDDRVPGLIQEATRFRESGCHKCKHKPLLSEILYECPICGGMVCRDCGSCLCNWNPEVADTRLPS